MRPCDRRRVLYATCRPLFETRQGAFLPPSSQSKHQTPEMGRLVDYTSDDSDASAGHASPVANAPAAAARPAKKRKNAPEAEAAALPPLPSSFHDLYASTVRVSTVDDPSLHQGRKRQIPHVAGNWPTHLYIECECAPRPPAPETSQRVLFPSRAAALNRAASFAGIWD